MRSAAFREEGAGLIKAQLTVNGETHLGGVIVFLAVIFPPAKREQLHRTGRVQCLISTAKATITDCGSGAHTGMDGRKQGEDYGQNGRRRPTLPD